MAETLDLFATTTRPSKELFYSREDPNDARLGELVAREPHGFESSRIVVLGCPQDEGIRRNRGRAGSAEAPTEIRRALYRLSAFGVEPGAIFDLGDTRIQPSLEETHSLQLLIVRQLLSHGKRVVALGGGNDISYPDCAALSLESSQLIAFNVDAHFDVRADAEANSGTPYRQLLEENLIPPERFFEMAYQRAVNSPTYYKYLLERGVSCVSLEELRAAGVRSSFAAAIALQKHDAIFWGFDLDAVRAADAPGVSAPSPTGLTAEELCDLAWLAGSQEKTRIVEFTEVNPKVDRDNQTARLAAFAIHCFLRATFASPV